MAYYTRDKFITRNIHCTNVFPIIKSTKSHTLIALKELSTNSIANGARVELLNLQGRTFKSAKSGESGIVRFDDLKVPATAMRINYQGSVSFFSIRPGQENELTEFNVSTNVKDVDSRIMVYAERGVWRPGDTVHLNVMLNRSKYKFANGLPISIEFKNPQGVPQYSSLQNVSGSNIYSFKLPISLDAKTGYWKANIKIGPHKISKSIRVENIRPNVVEVHYKLKGQDGAWIYNDRLSGHISVNYLTGIPLKKGNIESTVRLKTIRRPFEGFNEFVFAPIKMPDKNLSLFNGKTDEAGSITLKNKYDLKAHSSILKMDMDSKVSLPGGGLNSEAESYLISPFESYVGIKEKQRRYRYYYYGETPVHSIINVDQKGNLIAESRKIKVELFRFYRDWWYERYRRNFQNNVVKNYKNRLVHSEEMTTQNGRVLFKHDSEEYGSGMFFLAITDLQSGHRSEVVYRKIFDKNYVEPEEPIFLEMKTDKDEYVVGDNMKVSLPNFGLSKVLVSIEAEDKVLHAFWADGDSRSIEIPIKPEYGPNVYLHVSVVQTYGLQENDRPLRLYGVKRIKVSDFDNRLSPKIESPAECEPNETLVVKVSEEKGRSMEYTLAVVDNGLLNITNFKTPDPIEHFSKLVALKVKTWDIFKKLILSLNPAYAGILSIGGDEVLQKLDESADFNRFKPVVYHIGPIKLKAGTVNKHDIPIPNYLGKVKVMVVACNNSARGSTDEDVRIVSPLMVQSQLPRVLNVTDSIHVPVTLFKSKPEISHVNLSTTVSNDKASFLSNSTKVNVSRDQEVITAPLYVGKSAGETPINIVAKSGNFVSEENTKIFINYPNSYSSKEKRITVKKGDEINLPISCFGFPEARNMILSVAGVPMPNIIKHAEDLIQYPYGCLEQTISRAFAMLYLDELADLSVRKKSELNYFLNEAIQKINTFQSQNGSFNYWNNGYYHAWSDLYAGHFLLLANEKGAWKNQPALKNWIDHHKKAANQWRISGALEYVVEREELTQAYRLFLLALANQPQKGAMNRFRKRNLKMNPMLLLSGAYNLSGMKDVAEKLYLDGRKAEKSKYRHYFHSSISEGAMMIYTRALAARDSDLDRLYKNWVEKVNGHEWMSTHDKGFAFMALHKYLNELSSASNEVDFSISSNKYSERFKLNAQSQKTFMWNSKEMDGSCTIKNNADGILHLTITERGISDDIYIDQKSSKLLMNVNHTGQNGAINLSNINHGDEITTTILIKNLDVINHENLALSFKVPSGWELINDRLFTTSSTASTDKFTYQDFKDDRVYTFFDLDKNESKRFYFKSKASLKGNFFLPSISCENMYDGHVYARTASGRCRIK